MRFKDLLTQYTEGRTLDSIVESLEQKGFKVGRVTLSRWRSGDRFPPEDEGVIRALADICDRPAEPLLMLASAEREPYQFMQYVVKLLLQTSDLHSALYEQLERFLFDVKLQIRNGRSVKEIESYIVAAEQVLKGDRDTVARVNGLYRQIDDLVYLRFGEEPEPDSINQEEPETDPPAGLHAVQWAADKYDSEWRSVLEAKLIHDLAETTQVQPMVIWAAIAAAKAAEVSDRDTLAHLSGLLGIPQDMAIPKGDSCSRAPKAYTKPVFEVPDASPLLVIHSSLKDALMRDVALDRNLFSISKENTMIVVSALKTAVARGVRFIKPIANCRTVLDLVDAADSVLRPADEPIPGDTVEWLNQQLSALLNRADEEDTPF